MASTGKGQENMGYTCIKGIQVFHKPAEGIGHVWDISANQQKVLSKESITHVPSQ